MVTPITDLIDSIRTMPPALLAIILIAGPTLAFFLAPSLGIGRRARTPATSSETLLWVCEGCHSANEMHQHRCYRCGRVQDATPDLRVVDSRGVMSLREAATIPGTAAAAATTAGAPAPAASAEPAAQVGVAGALGAKLHRWRVALIPPRAPAGPSYRIVATPPTVAPAARPATATSAGTGAAIGLATPATSLGSRPVAPTLAGPTPVATRAVARPTVAPIHITPTSGIRTAPAAAAALTPAAAAASSQAPAATPETGPTTRPAERPMAPAAPPVTIPETAVPVMTPAHPGLAVGASRPTFPGQPAIIGPRRIVTSDAVPPRVAAVPISLPPIAPGALALERPAYESVRAALAGAPSKPSPGPRPSAGEAVRTTPGVTARTTPDQVGSVPN